MRDAAPATRHEARWRDWRTAARAWGPPGNERLTTAVGLVLLVLLGIETLTTLALRSYLPEHIFLGLLLIPPIILKLASTGWRFLRYYTNRAPYRRAGPPRLLLRLLAPLLIAATVTLFGSGRHGVPAPQRLRPLATMRGRRAGAHSAEGRRYTLAGFDNR